MPIEAQQVAILTEHAAGIGENQITDSLARYRAGWRKEREHKLSVVDHTRFQAFLQPGADCPVASPFFAGSDFRTISAGYVFRSIYMSVQQHSYLLFRYLFWVLIV